MKNTGDKKAKANKAAIISRTLFIDCCQAGIRSGEIRIRGAVNKSDVSDIALLSLTQEATVRGCFLGNACAKCSFVIEDLPVGTKVFYSLGCRYKRQCNRD